jgi:hypothetical protein
MADLMHQDAERLQEALKTLRTPTRGLSRRGRELLEEGLSDPMAALQAEIDRTVLRRALRFTNDRSEVLRIEASERRILSLSHAAHGGVPITPEDPVAVQAAIALLGGFCDGTTSLIVVSDLIPDAAHQTLIGLPASVLTGRPPDDDTPACPQTWHVDDLRKNALAYIEVKGGYIASRWGSRDLVDRLELCVAEVHEPTNPCTLWVDPSPRGLCIGYIQLSETTVWITARADQLQLICTMWSGLIAKDK